MMTPIGGCGFLLMGIIADASNLIAPFVIPLFGYFVVLLFASELLRKAHEAASWKGLLCYIYVAIIKRKGNNFAGFRLFKLSSSKKQE